MAFPTAYYVYAERTPDTAPVGFSAFAKLPKSRRSKEGVPDGVLCIRRADA